MHLQDLASTYAGKTDEELLLLATKPDQLTPEAFSTLTGELARRKISPQQSLQSDRQGTQPINQSGAGLPEAKGVNSAGDFVTEVLRLYHSHFWVFIKLTAPAVLAGYLAVRIARHEVSEIFRHLPRGIELLSHRSEILEIWLINLVGYLTSWLAFSLSFAAICSAVDQTQRGSLLSAGECLVVVNRRLGPVVRLTILLFFLLLALVAAAGFAGAGLLWGLHRLQVRPGSLATWIVFVMTAAAGLLLSRFALAMPAIVLEKYKITQALFRSDELTEGKWLTLGALLSKSLIGGYLAGMLPFWTAIWLWPYIHLSFWFTIPASLAGVTLVEPTMFIGFALLYIQTAQLRPASNEGPVG